MQSRWVTRWRPLKTLKKEGKIRRWGVSAGDLDVARAAVDKGAEVLSMAYNLFSQTDVNRVSGDVMVSRVGLLAPLARSRMGFSRILGPRSASSQRVITAGTVGRASSSSGASTI